MTTEKPKAYILVGVPGAGKTTWVKQQNFEHQDTIVVSTDRYIEALARRNHAPYQDVFEGAMPQAIRMMVNSLRRAVKLNKNIVWDQTSVDRESRRKKIRMIPPTYEKIAVVLPTPEREELLARIASRTEKVIPEEVVDNMIMRFQEPVLEEGFDKIINVGQDDSNKTV